MSEPKIVKREVETLPEYMLYTTKHTWATVTAEGNIRVGLTNYSQKHLKGIAQVLTEPLEKEVTQMEPFGVAETWVFVFDLYAPVSGKIARINEKLNAEPYVLNEDPYNKGWIIEIKPNSSVLEHELGRLLCAPEYRKTLERD